MKLRLMLLATLIGGSVWAAPTKATADRQNLARIDVLPAEGTVQLVEKAKDVSWEQPRWFAQGRGGVLQFAAAPESREGSCKLKAEAEGMLKIWLLGPDVRGEDGKKQKYYVEFAELNINGKPLLTEPVKVWHDAPKIFSLPVKAGEELEITAKYKTVPGGDR